MSPKLVVRRCAEQDMPQVRDIYALEVREGTASFELQPPTLAEMTARFAAVDAAGLPYLVAEQEGRIAGYAYAGPYRPRPAYRHTVEDSVYVARWARRQGVGRALLETVIQRATEQGMRQMIAIIGDSAHAASIRLHAQAGFRLVGTLEHVGWKCGRWLDTVIMQRPLGDGAASPPASDHYPGQTGSAYASPAHPQSDAGDPRQVRGSGGSPALSRGRSAHSAEAGSGAPRLRATAARRRQT